MSMEFTYNHVAATGKIHCTITTGGFHKSKRESFHGYADDAKGALVLAGQSYSLAVIKLLKAHEKNEQQFISEMNRLAEEERKKYG